MEEWMAWTLLLTAAVLEPVWVTMLDKSHNFKDLRWGIPSLVLVIFCLYLLAQAVTVIGPGVAYAILAGIAAIGVMAVGRVLYREKITPMRIGFVAMIVIGIIGVRLVSGGVI